MSEQHWAQLNDRLHELLTDVKAAREDPDVEISFQPALDVIGELVETDLDDEAIELLKDALKLFIEWHADDATDVERARAGATR